MPKQLFRTQPPHELLAKFLSCAGKGIRDRTWFTKSCISLSKFEELLTELEPYYLPCASKEYIHTPLTQARAITILRHILHAHSARLHSCEKTLNGVRGVWYQVLESENSSKNILEDEVQVVFA